MTTTPREALRLARRARALGPRGATQKVVAKLQHRLGGEETPLPLRAEDIADSSRLPPRETPRPVRGRPLVIGWVTTPPTSGSGGHTTMFRMIGALERAGHRCVVLVYDPLGADATRYTALVRQSWPWVRAVVRSVDDGFDDLDAVIATAWPTAHVVASRPMPPIHRFYFAQDYEPFFYARGPEYALAADSYRLGLGVIALGRMVQDRLRTELEIASELVPFSVDTSVYNHVDGLPRNGVAFYAKPTVPRRGYILAALALEEFQSRHPEAQIHVYGDPVPGLRVRHVHHGKIPPTDLAALYNRCVAGLAMSFTNISLAAEEMLACGCVPIVNGDQDARADLTSPYVAWASSTPAGIADALSRVMQGRPAPADVAASARADDWRDSGVALVDIIEKAAYAATSSDFPRSTVAP